MCNETLNRQSIFPFPFPCGPFGTGPFIPKSDNDPLSFGGNEGLRLYALAAGELHGSAMVNLVSELKGKDLSVKERLEIPVRYLVEGKQISESEAGSIKRILDYMLEENRSAKWKLKRIHVINRKFQEQNASDVALVISGIAVNSHQLVVEGVSKDNVPLEDVKGTLMGAVLGGIFGGVIGGAAASLAAAYG